MTDTVKILLAEATNAQLRYYAEGVLNLEGIKSGQHNAFLMSKIMAVVPPETTEIELPKNMALLGTTAEPVVDLAPAPAGVDGVPDGPESRHYRYDPKVEVEVQPTNDKTRPRDCYINCNGDVLQLQRGKVVAIPYRHFLVLRDAREMVARDSDEINPLTHMPIKEYVEQPSYPFTVHNMPSREEIAAWHARTDNEELRTRPVAKAA